MACLANIVWMVHVDRKQQPIEASRPVFERVGIANALLPLPRHLGTSGLVAGTIYATF